MINRLAPDAVRDSKYYFEELRQRQVEKLLQSFDPSADKDRLRAEIGKVVALVPEEKPIGVETLGATGECKVSGLCTKQIVLEYKYPDRWILFQVTVSNRSGHSAITELYVTPESMPLESMKQFTFRGKGWPHYAILLSFLLCAAIALYALVSCIRTPIRKRKWLWIVVTILGVGKLGIEWSSGQLWYKVAYLSILPAGWGFDSESPFMYSSIPAGAILFLLLRNRLKRTDAPTPRISPATPDAEGQVTSDCVPPTSA
ncbi:MAG: hypothetical protein ACLGSD_05490 [Acidobacteriota bacterium]